MSLTVFAGSAQLASLPLIASRRADVGDLGVGVLRQPALRPSSARNGASTSVTCRAAGVSLLGYFLADLNLVVFQKAWPSGRTRPGRRATPPAARSPCWLSGRRPSLAGILLSALRAARLGPRLRRHALDARHRLLPARRPDRVGRGHRRRGWRRWRRLRCRSSSTSSSPSPRRSRRRCVDGARPSRAARSAARADDVTRLVTDTGGHAAATILGLAA